MSDNVSQGYEYYAMQTAPPPFYGSFSMRIQALYILEVYLAYHQLALGAFLCRFIRVFEFNHLIPYDGHFFTMLENHSLGSYDL